MSSGSNMVPTVGPAVAALQLDVAAIDPNEANALFRRIRRRLLPLLFFGYTFAFLDRINVGFTQLQMKQDLGITDAHFGLAAGLFFLTYVICEAPSNLLSCCAGGGGITEWCFESLSFDLVNIDYRYPLRR